MWKIHVYAVFAYKWCHCASVFCKICVFASFWRFLPQLKNFFQKSECVYHPLTRHHLCAKFEVLRPSQSWNIIWRKKNKNDPDTHPAYFANCEPQCCASRNMTNNKNLWSNDTKDALKLIRVPPITSQALKRKKIFSKFKKPNMHHLLCTCIFMLSTIYRWSPNIHNESIYFIGKHQNDIALDLIHWMTW